MGRRIHGGGNGGDEGAVEPPEAGRVCRNGGREVQRNRGKRMGRVGATASVDGGRRGGGRFAASGTQERGRSE